VQPLKVVLSQTLGPLGELLCNTTEVSESGRIQAVDGFFDLMGMVGISLHTGSVADKITSPRNVQRQLQFPSCIVSSTSGLHPRFLSVPGMLGSSRLVAFPGCSY
jgi:hypothetical protein